MNDFDRRLDEHSRVQNTHLVSIDSRLEKLGDALSKGAQERTSQIGEVSKQVSEGMLRLALAALALVVPIAAGLLYLALKP